VLSDRSSVLPVESRELCAFSPTNHHTFGILNEENVHHPWDSPAQSPGPCHTLLSSARTVASLLPGLTDVAGVSQERDYQSGKKGCIYTLPVSVPPVKRVIIPASGLS